MANDTRIIAVTLAGRAPMMALATVTGSAVHIASMEALPRQAGALRERLEELAAKAAEAGAEYVIEDTTGLFGDLGRPLRLDDKDVSGRPVLVTAMERYSSLEPLGAITFPRGQEGVFRISASLYNVNHNDSGKTTYSIDWERLKDQSRLMLMCVHAGLCQTPYQSGWLGKMLNALGQQADADRDPFSGLEQRPSDHKDGMGGRRIRL